MTETQERFLRTVLTRVPLDSVVELHLFPPIRRGTLETGVAVIATALPPAPLTVVDGDAAADALVEEMIDAVVAETVIEAAIMNEAEIASETDSDTETSVEATADVESESETTEAHEAADVIEGATDDVQAAGDEAADADDDSIAPEDDQSADWGDEVGVITIAPPAPSPRMRILTASYRHTIKGVERGKWTVDVQEEADAPLEAVELVLRGVRHRSTEPADPELVTHDALVALLAPAAVAPAA